MIFKIKDDSFTDWRYNLLKHSKINNVYCIVDTEDRSDNRRILVEDVCRDEDFKDTIHGIYDIAGNYARRLNLDECLYLVEISNFIEPQTFSNRQKIAILRTYL